MILKREYLLIVFLSSCVLNSEESRILGIFPNPGKEDIFNKALVKILVERGHHVDFISTFEMENLSGNYSQIFNLSEVLNSTEFDLRSELYDTNFTRDPIWFIAQKYGNELCYLMGHKKMQMLLRELRDNSKYDLVLTEIFGANCFIGLGHFLQVPVIGISNHYKLPWIEDSIGNPKSISFVPSILSELSEITDFYSRLKNSLTIFFQTYRFHLYTRVQTEIMRSYLNPKIPEISQVEKNISLILSDSHFSLNSAQPVTSAFIEVGGLHIAEDKSNLPPKLKNWLDKRTKGVVYFDLGSRMTIENLPRKVIFALLPSFAKIKPVRVLLRVKDAKKLPLELPRNVKISSWIPRSKVLGHENVKAFITPGENSALQEALYFGVPIIGIPIYLDHFLNLQTLVKNLVAFQVNFEEISERKMSEALTIVLRIPLIRTQTKHWSNIFRDRPLSAKETAIYWIEYIIKNGPNSLKSPTIFFSWYEKESLDVLAFLLFFFLSFLYLTIFIITKIIRTIYK